MLDGWWLVLIWCERKTLLLVASRTEVHVPCEACLMIIAWPFSLFLMLTNWPCLIHSWPFLCFVSWQISTWYVLWDILHETNLVSEFQPHDPDFFISKINSYWTPRPWTKASPSPSTNYMPEFLYSNKVACTDWPCQKKRHQRHKQWQVRQKWGIYVWCVHSEVIDIEDDHLP